MIKTSLSQDMYLDNDSTKIKYIMGNEFHLTKKIYKGDILIIDFGVNIGREKSGIRPAVVVSNNNLNENSENITVAPMTKYVNKIKYGVKNVGGTQFILSNKFYRQMKSTSVVQMEDMRSVSKKRIGGFLGNLSPKSMEDMEDSLKYLL